MHGLVSLLPPPFYQEVQTLWKELELAHGLQGIKITPYPHFAWQIAEEYNFDRLEGLMQAAVRDLSPFTVRTAGMGVFSGHRPVLYINMVKSVALMELHARLYERFGAAGRGVSPLYAPDQWRPHISLAFEDVDQNNISSIFQQLCRMPFAWEMEIDNLAVIYQPAGSVGELRSQFKFQGGGEPS